MDHHHSPSVAAAAGSSQPSSPPDKDNTAAAAAAAAKFSTTRSREGSLAVTARAGGTGSSSQQKVEMERWRGQEMAGFLWSAHSRRQVIAVDVVLTPTVSCQSGVRRSEIGGTLARRGAENGDGEMGREGDGGGCHKSR